MFLYAAAAVVGSGLLLLWLLGRRTPPQPWQVLAGGGLRAQPRPANRIVFAAMLLACAGLAAADANLGGSATQPLLIACVVILRELVRSPAGAVTVSPAGLSLGERLYPWTDVHVAYLVGKDVELRVPPRWITCFGDRRVYLRGRAHLVPGAEIHWLIQHYLLVPAERERMDTLPTRAYELRA